MPEPLNDEQFIQRRMVMAALLSAVVLGGYMYFFAPRPEPVPVMEVASETAEPTAPGMESTAIAESPAFETPPSDQSIEASREETVVIETDTVRVEFTNRGATVEHWILKNYNDAAGNPLDLVHQDGAKQHGRPFRLVLSGGEDLAGSDDALFKVSPGPSLRRAPERLVFDYAKDGLSIRKTFVFERDGYVVGVETEVAEGGRPQRHLIGWGGGFGDTAQAGNEAHSETYYFDAGDIEHVPASDAEDGRISHEGPFPFVGISDLFFTAAAIPEPGEEIRIETSAVGIVPVGADVDDIQVYAAAGFGGAPTNRLRGVRGPQEPRLASKR